MQNQFMKQPDHEKLKEENDFLKMKLMLEKGAVFGGEEQLSPELEYEFLHHVLEMEKRMENLKLVTIRERMGNPDIRPVSEIPEAEIGEAWHEYSSLLARNGISVSACSPRISLRELYRFATEELPQLEMDEMSIPGMMTCFIYDEFYPDPIYECEVAATQLCIRLILSGSRLQYDFNFAEELELNGTSGLSFEAFAERINRFKELFSDVNIVEVKTTVCEPAETSARVEGTYIMDALVENEWIRIQGDWKVGLVVRPEIGFWVAQKVEMKGVGFGGELSC